MKQPFSISGIYQLKNELNGLIYVGSSKNIFLRIADHISNLKRGSHQSKKLQRHFTTFGMDAFSWEVLEELKPDADLFEREQFWLDELQAYDPKFGYCKANNVRSPRKGTTCSDLTRAKQSLAAIERWADPEKRGAALQALEGKRRGNRNKRTAAQCERMSQATTRTFQERPELKQQIAATLRGNTNASGTRSSEVIEKFRENAKRQFAGQEGKAELLRRARLGNKARNRSRRLHPDQVRQIRQQRADGITFREISEAFSIPIGSLSAIIDRRQYADVD